ncbi:MAG: hypothetical protein CL931_03760 [Deltaproteobacteria bacterium]|nr:hypothetical protein [Deltaproteobacteria bacterium]
MSQDRERLLRAMKTIERLQSRLEASERASRAPVAVIGLGCRFPGGEDPDAFWELLDRGGDAIGPVPTDRWDAEALFDSNPATPGKVVTREGGFIGSPREFDASFFGLSPREAATLDPQQRLLLEVGWEAMEHARVVPSEWQGDSIGVFVGISGHDYSQRLLSRPLESIDPYLATGNSHSVAAGRLAYTWGFNGPAMAVDTACSSSLVALHLAVASLRRGECRAALVGGVNRLLSPEFTVNFSSARMLAPDGRCKAFGEGADGFGRAEGCGVLVLKRLDEARRDGDRVLAIVRGSAVNQDGRSGGLTVPNGPAQQAVIRAALADAGIEPADVDYVEAHGTGTELGDPIEARALGEVFGGARDEVVRVGSLKTNVGHMEAAAGIGGVIKTILALDHESLPKHLHCEAPSTRIPWDETPIQILRDPEAWKSDRARNAGVSSFGFSGTNAHVVLAGPEAIPGDARPAPEPSLDRASLLCVSARERPALAAQLDALRDSIAGGSPWTDVCFSALRDRECFEERVAVVARDRTSALEAIERVQTRLAAEDGGVRQPAHRKPRVAFLFTGQGSQAIGMGRGLYATQPAFRAAIDRCADWLSANAGLDLLGLIHPAPGGEGWEERAARELEKTEHAQPALFALAYGLCEAWRAWGVEPSAVLGHSIGEYAAAVAAGVLGVEEALEAVVLRGRLMGSLPPNGGMVVVFGEPEKVGSALPAGVEIAAMNGPRNTVIAGTNADLAAATEALSALGFESQRLAVSHAFHSDLMAPILGDFERDFRAVPSAPGLRFYSTATGARVLEERLDAAYWTRQIRSPVRYAEAVSALVEDGIDLLVEIGSRPTLIPLSSRIAPEWQGPRIPSLRGRSEDGEDFLAALGAAFEAGVGLHWGDAPGAAVDLPTYRFVRREHWAAPDASERGHAALAQSTVEPRRQGVLGPALHPGDGDRSIHALSRDVLAQPIWQGHRVFGDSVLPAAGLWGLGLEAARRLGGEDARLRISAVHFTGALRLDQAEDAQIEVEPAANGRRFRVLSRTPNGDWDTHCVGRIDSGAAADARPSADLEAIRGRCPNSVDPEDCWARLAAQSVTYAPAWRLLEAVQLGENEALARIRRPERVGFGFAWDPIVADACVQACSALFLDRAEAETFLPASVGTVVVHGLPGEGGFVHAHLRTEIVRDSVSVSIDVYDGEGRPLLSLVDLRLRPISEARWHHERVDPDWFYHVRVDERRVVTALPQPRPEEVVEALTPAFRREAESDEQRAYTEVLGELDAAARGYAWSCRERLGEDATVPPRFERLWRRIRELACEAETRGEGGVSAEELGASLAALVESTPSASSEAALLERCGGSLAGVLRGEVAPMSLLFPDGDGTLVEAIYASSTGARLMNEQVAAAFAQLRREVAENGGERRPLRVLEIGAGTGATTRFLLDQLGGVDYTVSDVAPLLVERARERFGEHESLRFERFDVTAEPVGQGIALGSHDVVVAANVLHATSDLRRTLERIGGLLAPGGSLLLLESTSVVPFLDLIFGLTEGWWAFEDEALRPAHPLLSAAAWVELLRESGFEATALRPSESHEAAQSLIVARRPESPSVVLGRTVVLGEDEPLVNALTSTLEASSILGEAECDHVLLVPTPSADPKALAQQIDRVLSTIRDLVDRASRPRLTLVTRGATGEGHEVPTQAVLAGLIQVARLEHPGLDCARIDVDPSAAVDAQRTAVLEALASPVREARRLRDGKTRVERLERLPLASPDPRPASDYRIEPATRGEEGGVRFVPATTDAPGPGEVVVEVLAAGLNFIDVLDSMGMLPFERGWLGVECCGRVLEVGEGVKRCAVGDRVIALCEGSFRDRAIVRDLHLARLPGAFSALEGATLPATFLTAWQALVEVAGIEPGQTVLVHAGAGGTGMAAIQVARARGVRVFATASREKWETLRELGVEAPLDSRRPGFGEAVRLATDGRGVDVILNSLTGDFIDEGLRALAPGGTFLEIGKRDLRREEDIRAIRDDVDYRIVDLMTMAADEPERIANLFDAWLPALERGDLGPLPRQIFAVGHAGAALRFMRNARHTGKIVLDFGASGMPVDAEASYLITGGFGGLGLATARWLADAGARSIVLMGRRVPEEMPAELDGLVDRGVEVVCAAGDVAHAEDVDSAIEVAERCGPLRGVVHAAGVLEDGLLKGLDAEKIGTVLRPKVEGALQLDRATRSRSLDFFVLYSSAASLLGSPGQAAHVAANGFLDALALHRRRRALPALSVGWGPWSETGSAANENVAAAMRGRGIGPIRTNQGLAALGALLGRADVTRVGVVPIDWAKASGFARDPFFSLFANESPARPAAAPKGPTTSPDEGVFAGLDRMPQKRRRGEIRRRLQREIGLVLGLPEGELPSAVDGFFDLGLDSLMAVDLTARLEASASLEFSSTTLFEYPNIAELSDHLDALVFANATEPEPGRDPEQPRTETPVGTPGQPIPHSAGEEEDFEAALAVELDALGELLND